MKTRTVLVKEPIALKNRGSSLKR